MLSFKAAISHCWAAFTVGWLVYGVGCLDLAWFPQLWWSLQYPLTAPCFSWRIQHRAGQARAEVSKEGITCSKEKNWPIGGAFKRICCWDVFGRQWRKSIVLTSLGLFWFWKPSSWMGWFKVSYQLLKRLIKLFNKIVFFACLQNRMLPAL